MEQLESLKERGEAPEWLQEEGYQTLCKGYLLEGETPKDMYKRVARAAKNAMNYPDSIEQQIFQYIWNNWICLSTPVAANLGTDRALPISCFGQSVADKTHKIFDSYKETAMLTKYGGGIGKYWGDVRGRGAKISKGGTSEGIIPWLKIEESVISAVSQSGVRRGASASYLPIEHSDGEEFIDIRRQTGDISRRCLSTSFHHGITITDNFMNEALTGNVKNRNLFEQLLKARVETGEPYVVFIDNANKNLPAAYTNNGLKVKTSQLCSEIFLTNDEDHTFVCCLSSLNLARYDEWRTTNVIQIAVYLLDAVMEEFIQKSSKIEGFENSHRFAVKSRALGLGVLGWHTYLQKNLIPFDSMEAMTKNAEIFRLIDKNSKEASRELAVTYGEPEWCKGTGMRNTHLVAVAPTVSNSLISGGVSQGIEPIVSNIFMQKSAKGNFIRKNPGLEALLESKGFNTFEVWQSINENNGSVKHLKQLNDVEREVFQTAREINQFAIVRQAGQRQRWIDQGASVNLFFTVPTELNDLDLKKKLGKYIHEVHLEAWRLGVKSLYYCRTESPIKGDNVYREASDCKACEG